MVFYFFVGSYKFISFQFIDGPDSRHDVIELRGFDENEVKYFRKGLSSELIIENIKGTVSIVELRM